MAYKRGINYAIETADKIEKNYCFVLYRINELEWASTLQLITKLKKRISFIDYFVIYLAINSNEPILCFDEDINKLVKILR